MIYLSQICVHWNDDDDDDDDLFISMSASKFEGVKST